MDGIPPVLSTDTEDVGWALQTAEALWKRGERVDAIVWLRRAAQAAGESDDDTRAMMLARSAAELTDRLAAHSASQAPMRDDEPSHAGVDDLLSVPPRGPEESEVFTLSGGDVEMLGHEDEEPDPFRQASAAPVARSREPAASEGFISVAPSSPDVMLLEGDDVESHVEVLSGGPSEPPLSLAPDAILADDDEAAEELTARSSVPTAAELHAGMLDPWAEAERRSQLPAVAPAPKPAPAVVLRTFEEEEVVTSAKSRAEPIAPPKAEQKLAPLPPPAPPPRVKPPLPRALPPRPPVMRAPAPPRAHVPAPESTTATLDRLADAGGTTEGSSSDLMLVESVPPPHITAVPRGESDRPTPVPTSVMPSNRAPPPTPMPASFPTPSVSLPDLAGRASGPSIISMPTPVPLSIGSRVTNAVPPMPDLMDLTTVEALGDLPDDAREAFALAATRSVLARDEEVSQFALALVLDGEVDVSSTLVDAPALRLEKSSILRSRGTMKDGVALRLVCASDTAIIATWDDEAVASAFRTCPWVEDDLRAVADRVQTKVGVTMGPLGERFDMALREHVTGKLTVRHLTPGEVIVEAGKPVPIVIVGVGDLELVKAGVKTGVLRPGDFLFSEQIMGGGVAPATARAGKGGALVLYGTRSVAQELLMSFPPLLDIFSGM